MIDFKGLNVFYAMLFMMYINHISIGGQILDCIDERYDSKRQLPIVVLTCLMYVNTSMDSKVFIICQYCFVVEH